MTGSMLADFRRSGAKYPEGNTQTGVSGRTLQGTGHSNAEDTRNGVQEEILAELRSINDVLKGIANTMESMEKDFWT